MYFEYNKSDKKVETEMFVYSLYAKVTLESNSNVFFKRVLKSIKKNVNNKNNPKAIQQPHLTGNLDFAGNTTNFFILLFIRSSYSIAYVLPKLILL